MTPDEALEHINRMSPEQRKRALEWYSEDVKLQVWRPLPGPQYLAYHSDADVIGFGGAAGGGKTDLAIGLALTKHHKVLFMRQHQTELTGIYDRLGEILGRSDYRDRHGSWVIPGGPWGSRKLRFGSFANAGDESKEQGKEKDLIVLEEAANMLEGPARFVMGWLRSARGIRVQALLTFNPPTTSEGRWIISFFAPWIQRNHPNPALPGELRWFIGTKKSPDTEVPDNRPRIELPDGSITTDFDPKKVKRELILKPVSRTFIPSRVIDNSFLAGTNYMSVLQQLPEPLRSQMLLGDFTAGIKDSEWQVIPTAWVEAACARWKALERKPKMESMGVDVARGGDDNTVIMRLHQTNWFDEPLVYPGTQTPDGQTAAGLIVIAMRDQAPIHVDVIGIGASVYDHLKANYQVIAINAAEKAPGLDKSGMLTFANVRSWMWWQFREALDPNSNLGIALPPDKRLIADLTTPRFEKRGTAIYVESREDLLKAARLGRSPDWGTATVQAWVRTPRRVDLERMKNPQGQTASHHDPYAGMGGGSYDPYR